MEIIRVEGLRKTFSTRREQVHAVEDVSFQVERGEIFGVIGLSGAGKSTLARCLNLLERPDGGSVVIDGQEMTALDEKGLRLARREIGMIFQGFHLLAQRDALDNVRFPLEIAGVRKREARERAMGYLETVGLAEKAGAYPAQLSGGQLQRVAIARVLAANPKLILCDEATSALDPQTTQTILDLLLRINREMGITMVVITHEMRVVEQICQRVAVLDRGRIAELGPVREVFDHPKTKAARRLLTVRQQERLTDALAREQEGGGEDGI